MNSRFIGDLTHVEHLLVVEGEPDQIAAFVAGARRGDVALSLQALVPPPQALADVDPMSLAHFHLVFGEQHEARNLYDELDEPWPLPDVDEGSRALRELLRTDTSISADARTVQKNLQTYGVLNAEVWKSARWGSSADLRDVAYELVNDDRVHYRFTSPVSRQTALHEIAGRYPQLSMGAIVTNFGARKHHWFYRFADSQDMHSVEQSFPKDADMVELFMDNPPELFAYAG